MAAPASTVCLTTVAIHDQAKYSKGHSHTQRKETEAHAHSPFMEFMP
ncbi:hypothetical protein QFZ96_002265 [Paraburkholderia youngii]